ncbi:MAG: prolyl oligopeptidase family serine peptidase [Patescibacteria group bacterium]
MDYPKTNTQNVFDNYFDRQIPDPYRWLEDDNSVETKKWVEEQNHLTSSYLGSIPNRDYIKDRLTKLWNYERFSVPKKVGGKYYFWKNDGLQNQSVLYRSANIKQTNELEKVLDPNQFSTDGTVAVDKIAFSNDAKFLAFSISSGGSDWRQIQVLDLETGVILPDRIEWVKFSEIAWFKNGFFYSRYPEPANKSDLLSSKNEYHVLYYHTLGTSQNDDVLIFQDLDHAERNVVAEVTDDEKYLVLYFEESTSGNAVSLVDLEQVGHQFQNMQLISLVSNFESDFRLVGNQGHLLYFLTNYKASNSQLLGVDFNDLKEANWQVLIPEREVNLEHVTLANGLIVAIYTPNAHNQIKVFNFDGKELSEVVLPEIGSVTGIWGRLDEREWFFHFSSFTTPGKVFLVNSQNQNNIEVKLILESKSEFNSSDYQTKQIFYESKDGTRIPMFIISKKDLHLDGNNQLWLYGYGGFNVSILPSFSPSKAVFLEQGGIYCVASIRGGGEFGKNWHKAGTKFQKQNVFDDFIAAAEFLIDQKYTSSEKLIIEGVSNGGLLVGACLTQRPDLFKVAIPRVGVLDMLRYHKFTIGWAWADDYGTSEESKEMFEYLLSYSPLHNCHPNQYPSVLITTADHDDRVVPAHSFKFGAMLQNAQVGKNPILIRIDTKAGHGAGKSTEMAIAEQVDLLTFALHETNTQILENN